MINSCPNCLSDNPAAARHCRRCGRKLSPTVISPVPLTPLMTAWRKLKRDLTRLEVKKLLGEPVLIVPQLMNTPERGEIWTYEYRSDSQAVATGELEFEPADGRLITWTEPDWKLLSSTQI